MIDSAGRWFSITRWILLQLVMCLLPTPPMPRIHCPVTEGEQVLYFYGGLHTLHQKSICLEKLTLRSYLVKNGDVTPRILWERDLSSPPSGTIQCRGTSLLRKRTPLGPYRRPMPRPLSPTTRM